MTFPIFYWSGGEIYDFVDIALRIMLSTICFLALAGGVEVVVNDNPDEFVRHYDSAGTLWLQVLTYLLTVLSIFVFGGIVALGIFLALFAAECFIFIRDSRKLIS